MTAPISNEPTTTRLHHYAGHYSRGKLTHTQGNTMIRRLIPAHAGKTKRAGKRGTLPRAHPRSRGENVLPGFSTPVMAGSSPLTRGKPLGAQALHGAAGLIPAHAGKTPCSGRGSRRSWAHPRSRGENAAAPPTADSRRGSSPLTRGKPRPTRPRPHHRRLIPAHAGKTGAERTEYLKRGAHPRSRGEN